MNASAAEGGEIPAQLRDALLQLLARHRGRLRKRAVTIVLSFRGRAECRVTVDEPDEDRPDGRRAWRFTCPLDTVR